MSDSTAVVWLRNLTPTDPATPPPASTAATIADAAERIGSGPVAWACEVGLDMATTIVEQITEIGGGAEQLNTLRMGTESSAIRALIRVAGLDDDLPAITEEALRGDREFVRRGVALDRVLRGVRLGHARMASAFLGACAAHVVPDDRAPQMQQISELLFDYIDEFAGAMAAEYVAERDRWMASAAAARAETVRAILAGEFGDSSAATAALDYDLSRDHVAMTFFYDPPRRRSDTTDLLVAAHQALTSAGATQRLVLPIGAGNVWAWGGRHRFPARIVLTDHRPTAVDIRVATGDPGAGVTGFRQSHREALAAERSARMARRPAPVTHYADVAVPALLVENLDAARAFVGRELGPLAERTHQAEDLRATLLQYFDDESSPYAAAQVLHVSRNTVAYRVKRASELLGYDVATRRYDLHAALRLVDTYGDAVL
ncbi:CdaR family transcriptional regulator [Rhodococcus sp. SORGH_AS_0301]|uniref:PucR family transcriptional regulator n=1 Tax=Rhodococcus sp. SORGH_AS_0301 TaxID=3041780 RepID=UPI00277F07BE|nr:helix-turn-helix domain-containing protein [Rhodococcus sp. SORGH_AS_0301]MDQ1181821.1 hypothetical protein [Rhodococcus sp. SORGH_AS_0301]